MSTFLPALILVIASPFAPPDPRPECAPQQSARRIIDVHVHAYNDGSMGPNIPNPVTGARAYATSEAEHREATFCALSRHNVVRAVVSNDWRAVQRWKNQDPKRVIAGIGLDDPKEFDLDFLRKERAAGRLDVIGEFGPQYAGFAPDDPALEPVFALAEELDIPVAFHMHPGPPGAVANFGMKKMRVANGRPLLLEPVLVRHPKLRIYVMHAGYPYIDEMIAILYAYPQVYVDVGVIDWTRPRPEFHRYLQRLVEPGFGKRILFGSDQMVWVDAIGLAIDAVESAPFLSEEQKDDIFFNNAVRFFRLEGLGRP
jgi:predicted TIM-barrel fold metal-dependent hydrolase